MAIGSGLLLQPAISQALEFEASGKVSSEITLFADEGQFSNQDYRSNVSFSVQPEFYWSWNDDQDSLTFQPFFTQRPARWQAYPW